jgi:DNA-binding response OmpR family regulator
VKRILVVEDEAHLAEGLKYNLEAEGYVVDVAEDGESALERISGMHGLDAVVLDAMLPGVSGFEVVAALRARGEFVPVLMLTAMSRPEDVLRGFEAGADDYLPKPFELTILEARLRGLLRRREWSRGEPAAPKSISRIEFDGRTIDFDAMELHSGGRTTRLTTMEADLLRYLIEREGRIVARKTILTELWGLHEDTDTRAIDNFIVRLRRYLEDTPSRPRHLLTVRGVGYKFVSAEERS